MGNILTPNETIDKIKEKAIEFAKNHATQNAKVFYELGKRDAASLFLSMIRQDGTSAIKDIAKEILRHDPEHQDAKWIIENA